MGSGAVIIGTAGGILPETGGGAANQGRRSFASSRRAAQTAAAMSVTIQARFMG